MSDSSAPSDPADGRLARIAESLSTLARRISGGVAVLAVSSAGAGLLLWGLLWWPVPFHLLPLLGAAATLGGLLAPAAVLGLFYQGLRDLWALPARLSEHTSRTITQSGQTVESVAGASSSGLGRLWSLLKQIWSLRRVLLDHRALLVRYGALFRFLTPGFLLLVVLAAGASLLLVPAAALAGLLAVLF
jgi:hypothetical protein